MSKKPKFATEPSFMKSVANISTFPVDRNVPEFWISDHSVSNAPSSSSVDLTSNVPEFSSVTNSRCNSPRIVSSPWLMIDAFPPENLTPLLAATISPTAIVTVIPSGIITISDGSSMSGTTPPQVVGSSQSPLVVAVNTSAAEAVRGTMTKIAINKNSTRLSCLLIDSPVQSDLYPTLWWRNKHTSSSIFRQV